MFQTKKQLKKIYKDLQKIFGKEPIDKIISYINSLSRALEDMEKSRNNWKNKYIKLKNERGLEENGSQT